MSGSLAKCCIISSQTPSSHQRAKRLYTLFQFPYSFGSKRHCAPLRLIHITASRKRRHFRAEPTCTRRLLRKNKWIFFHSSSRKCMVVMRLIMPHLSTQPSKRGNIESQNSLGHNVISWRILARKDIFNWVSFGDFVRALCHRHFLWSYITPLQYTRNILFTRRPRLHGC